MKISIDMTSLWPVYEISDSEGGEGFEVDKKTLKRWRKACNKFAIAQNEIEKVFTEQERE